MNRQAFVQRYGPWAVVTGASDGIGRAFAEQLSALGLNVALIARRRDRLERVAGEIRERRAVETLVIPADLSGVLILVQPSPSLTTSPQLKSKLFSDARTTRIAALVP